MAANNHWASGAKVRIAEPMEVPEDSEWDDDHGRTSGPVKKRLQGMFFRGDRKVTAEVVYIARESEREKLRRKGMVKVRAREASGTALTFTVPSGRLARA